MIREEKSTTAATVTGDGEQSRNSEKTKDADLWGKEPEQSGAAVLGSLKTSGCS